MIPGPYEKPEAYRLPASHTAGLAVQVCDSHFCTFPMYSLNLKLNVKIKKVWSMTDTTVTKFVLLPLPLYSPHVAKGGEQRTRPHILQQGGAPA